MKLYPNLGEAVYTTSLEYQLDTRCNSQIVIQCTENNCSAWRQTHTNYFETLKLPKFYRHVELTYLAKYRLTLVKSRSFRPRKAQKVSANMFKGDMSGHSNQSVHLGLLPPK